MLEQRNEQKDNFHIKFKEKSEEIKVRSRDLHEKSKENKVLKEVVLVF